MPPPRKIPARQRVLAQWRGVDLSPLETAKAVRARAAGDVVSRVLKDLHIDDRRAEAELVKVWNLLLIRTSPRTRSRRICAKARCS